MESRLRAAAETTRRPAFHLVLLVILTLLALMLRLYRLGQWSFWIDEIATVNGARYIADWPLAWLPIYLVLTHGAQELFGPGEWSARLAPAIVGAISVPLLYVPTRRIWGPGVALVAALLLAVSPWHVWWSQNARFYTLITLFYNLALLLLFLGLERRRRSLLVLALVFWLLAIREREHAFFFVPVLATYVLLLWLLRFERPPWLRPRTLLPVLLPALLFLAYDAYSYLVLGRSNVRTLLLYFVGNAIDSPSRILILILFNIGLPVVVLALFSGLLLVRQRSRRGLFFAVGALTPVLFLVTVSPFIFTVDRYALLALPLWLVLAAVGLVRLYEWLPGQGKLLAAAVLSVLLADAAGAHLLYFQLNNGNRPDWRGAFAYVGQRMADGDLVVSTWPELGNYYLGGDKVISLADLDPAALEQSRRRAWFVIDSEAVWFAPPENKQWVERNARLLDLWYLRVREQINLRLYVYTPRQP